MVARRPRAALQPALSHVLPTGSPRVLSVEAEAPAKLPLGSAVARRLGAAAAFAPGRARSRVGAKELAWAAVLIGLAAGAVYVRHVVRGGWYYDDWAIIARLDLADGIGGVLSAAFDESYRPGYALTISALYGIAGTGQSPYLLMGVALVALECSLFYWVLRLVGLSRLVAGTAAAFLLLLPTIDATRLWTAAFPPTFAVCLYLGGLVAALLGLARTDPRVRLAWHAGAIALYVASVLTYELLAPLVALSVLLYAVRADRRSALRRWVADCAAAAAALLLIADAARDRRGAEVSFDHLVDRAGQTLDAAARVFRDTLPAGDALAGPLGIVLALGVAAGILVALRRGGPDARAIRGWLLLGAGGLMFALAGLAMLLPAEEYYVPRLSGVGNRFSVAAALGEVVLLVSLAWLVALGVLAPLRRSAAVAPVAVVLSVVIGVKLLSTELDQQDPWADAWQQSQGVVSAVRDSVGETVPPRSGIVTFRHAGLLPGDVPVFAAPWDLRGAMRLLYRDPTIAANPWLPTYRCGRAALVVPPSSGVTGPPELMRYGDLWFVDAAAYKAYRIGSRPRCDRVVASLG